MLSEAAEDMRELEGEILARRAKFAELIIKCLWKVARRLDDSLKRGELEPVPLLLDVEAFMQVIPPSEWRRRQAEGLPLGEVPLRTIKVVLSAYAKTFGEDVLGMLESLPNPAESHVYAYLLRLLNKEARGVAPITPGVEEVLAAAVAEEEDDVRTTRNTEPTRSALGVTSPPMSPARRAVPSSARASMAANPEDEADAAANAELRGECQRRTIQSPEADTSRPDIFERISRKDESRAAIRALYEFQKRHPEKADKVDRSLQNTGPIFQRYIKRALDNHRAEDGDAAPLSPPQPAPASPALSTSSRARASVLIDAAPSSPAGNGHARSSTSDERLAQLRAKFGKTSSSADSAYTPTESAAAAAAPPSSSEALRQQLAALRSGAAA